MTDLIDTIISDLTPKDSASGESVIVTTKIFDNGDYDDNSQFTETTINLCTFGRSALLNISNMFDNGEPEEQIKFITNALLTINALLIVNLG